jgi:hypothetical protein
MPISLDYLQQDGLPGEDTTLRKAEAYARLQGQDGYALLLDFLRDRHDEALQMLRDNGDPSLEVSLLMKWRERVGLMDAIAHEIESTVELAKEIRNARRTETA